MAAHLLSEEVHPHCHRIKVIPIDHFRSAGPDFLFGKKLTAFLQHKGDPWNWQNAQVLTRELSIAARFYVLSKGEAWLANICTFEVVSRAPLALS